MLAAALPFSAVAQTSDGVARVEEVVVTAQRREATLQDAAVAVSAVSGQRLEAAGVQDTTALQLQIPSLLISTNTASQSQVYIRGVGNTITGVVSSNSVATYLDGVYVANGQAATQTFNDVERVEVLKGPQSTLYGRNATGGAIVILSKDPTFDQNGSFSGSVGNYKAYSARLTLNGELLPDVLAGRVSLFSQEHEGYGHNVHLGTRPGGDQQWGARAALKFVATPTLDFVVRADYRYINASDYGKHLNPNSYIYLTANTPGQYINDPWAFAGEVNNSGRGQDGGIMARASWRTSLGALTSVTSYRRYFLGPQYSDFDSIVGTFNGNSRAEMAGDKIVASQWYHETTFATPSDLRLQALLGFSLFSGEAVQESKRIATGNIVGSARRVGKDKAWATFIDLGFDLTDELRLVGGVRYTHDEIDFSQLVRVTNQGVGPGFAENSLSANATSPRMALEWRPAPGRLFYVSATNGFKSGGFNETAPSNPFKPETVWSYEFGAKTVLFDGKLTANASAFYYDYTDLQISRITPITQARLVANADKSKIYGADIELHARPSYALELGASLSLLHSEFGHLVICDNVAGPCSAPPNDSGFIDIKGRQLNNAPKTTLGLYADYELPIELKNGRLQLHTDASYRSRTYFTPYARKEWQSDPANWILNAELKYSAGSDWYVAAYVRNLTDEVRVNYASASGVLRVPSTSPTAVGTSLFFARLDPPRTFGVRFGVNF
jgi:iron complex outermembrane receptor protein